PVIREGRSSRGRGLRCIAQTGPGRPFGLRGDARRPDSVPQLSDPNRAGADEMTWVLSILIVARRHQSPDSGDCSDRHDRPRETLPVAEDVTAALFTPKGWRNLAQGAALGRAG